MGICVILLFAWEMSFAAGGVFTPKDRDYFTANEDFETLRDLALIDEAHTDRVMYWLRTDNVNRAIQDLKFTLDRFPNHPRALLLFELVGKIAQVPNMALPYYEKAVSLYPQYASIWAQYGKYLVEIGRDEDGIKMLQKAIEVDNNLAAAHAWLSDAYMKNGKMDLARAEYEKAKALGFKGAPAKPSTQPGHK
jgi:Tfp pilus assembly protein PilF